jgi:2-dehydro-3-deoxy-D-arabinonate dehydratase
MKIGRFKLRDGPIRIGLATDDDSLLDLTSAGIDRMDALLETDDPAGRARDAAQGSLPRFTLSTVRLCAPIEQQEIWAAGVTYLRSKAARMEESDFSASAYDRVYAAARPELFFKSLPEKVVAPGDPVGIRRDARWSVPEPELVLVMNSRGRVVGQTIGNDMSSRDIEGENLLYLPQAKIYERSCAIGPWITLGSPETAVRTWSIRLVIRRGDAIAFAGETSVGNLQRSFDQLAGYLYRSQAFPHGAALLTGTGIVPPDLFTLQAADVVEIEISGIGLLRNPVVVV